MTKVITYNNIQLSFQADTSGIKASKAELGALTREVKAHQSPLDRYVRKLEVINQLEQTGRLSKKDIEDRLRAVTRTYIDAAAKTGEYENALRKVSELAPRLATEVAIINTQLQEQIKKEKELTELEGRRVALEQLKARQNEDKRLQIERQVLEFKQKQRDVQNAAQKEENRIQSEIEKRKRQARLREIADYVDDFERKKSANAKFQQMIIQPQEREQILLNQAIVAEQTRNAAVQRRMNMYRQMPSLMSRERIGLLGTGLQELAGGASMAGIPGGALLGIGLKGFIGFAATAAIVSSVKAYADLRNELVKLEVQFGSVSVAGQKFSEIRKLASQTPLETRELMRATVVMSQYGFTANEATSALRKLADVSGGNAMNLEGLARALGQTRAAGKLMGQELLQFINAGFNPLLEISRNTKIEMGELRKVMESGGISYRDVLDTITSSTSEGGRFFQQSAKQAKELTSQINAMKDAIRQLAEEFGKILSPTAIVVIKTIAITAQSMTTFLSDLQKVVVAIDTLLKGLMPGGEGSKAGTKLFEDLFIGNMEQMGITFTEFEQKEKLFQNILRDRQRVAKEAAKAAEQEKNKQLEGINEEIAGLKSLEEARLDYLRATMDGKAFKAMQTESRIKDYEKESQKLAELQIEQERVAKGLAGMPEMLQRPFLIEAQKRIDEFKKLTEAQPMAEEAQKIKERLSQDNRGQNAQVAIMQAAQDIANMINAGLLTQQAGSQELARVMMENTQATQQQSQELPRTIQAGTVEAYQAMFGKDNTAKLQLSEQKKQNDKLSEANGILKQIAAKPGMKKV